MIELSKINNFFHSKIGFRVNRATLMSTLRDMSCLKKYWILGSAEISSSFGVTALGILWQPVTVGVTVFGVGFVFGHLFNINSTEYIPYFSVSLVLWQYLITNMIECSSVFSRPGEYQNMPFVSLSLYLIRIIAKNTILLSLNLLVVVIAFAICKASVSLVSIVFAILGLAMFVLFNIAAGMLLSIAGSRFNDIPNIIQNVMQMMFYITPIMWKAETIRYAWIYEYNPLFYLFGLVRLPLLYSVHSPNLVMVSFLLIAILAFLTLLVWSIFAWRINYHSK